MSNCHLQIEGQADLVVAENNLPQEFYERLNVDNHEFLFLAIHEDYITLRGSNISNFIRSAATKIYVTINAPWIKYLIVVANVPIEDLIYAQKLIPHTYQYLRSERRLIEPPPIKHQFLRPASGS